MRELSKEMLESLFYFDLEAGKVYWKSPPKTHPRMQDKEAGTLRPSANGKIYCSIHVDKRAIKRGRLIFFIVNGFWPRPCVDHINGDSTDDRPTNLRQATVTQNSWNHKKRAKLSNLPMGVRSVKSGRFQARIAVNNKMIHLGTFETPGEASDFYQAKRKEFYGEFA